MSKKGTKALASATLLSLVLTTALSAGPVKAAATGQTTRIAGADRYATAAAVATKDGKTNDNVVLVSGEGYADAVSGSVLAKTIDAPILLTQSNTLSADTTKALNTLKPKNIYVIGGTASVSQSIRDQLKDGGYNLVELGGANRYETNVAVANELVKNHGISADKVMVVGGEGFSDALSVAPVAAAKGQILLLGSNSQSDMKSVIDFVNANRSNATVIGTSNIMKDSILKALGVDPSTRINGGLDRFETNLNVLKAFSSDLKADSIYVANATADDGYADALVASALAGKTASPLILVDTNDSSATANALSYYNSEKTDSTSTYVVGGEGVISKDLYAKFGGQTTPGGDTDQSDSVSSVESNGLRQIKVVFDGEVDQDTAEDVTNYKVDGTTLVDGKDKAVLQDDNRTVLITFQDKQKQNDDVDVTVKKGILSADKSVTVKEYTTTVNFKDTTAPSLKSVDAKGNKKITVEFSEPVNVGSNENASGVYSKFKINDKNISSYGLNTKYTVAKDAVSDGSDYWTNKIDFYFDTALPTGNNTLKISDGDENALEDAANFPITETTQDFNVDTLTTTPEIKSIEANDDGKVYINFDRPMDAKTATNYEYYKINDIGLTSSNKVELKKDDTQVKISGVDLNKGANKLYIDDNVKDAYGNNIEEDTYESFNLEEDTTKPSVNSVYALDDSTIRVKYSKSVDTEYAKNISNYTLLDGDGVDISKSEIKDITVPGDNTATTADVYDINLKSGNKLTDEKYTLTISNIQDKATTPNVMDDYTTTFDGSGDVNAEVTGVYKVSGDSKKITIVFNKAMDSSALSDVKNYQYTNVKGDTKTLPSSAETDPSSDNKAVTITLPDSLTTDLSSLKDDEYKVKALYATDVEDSNGNKLQVGSQGGTIKDATTGAKTKSNSLKVYYDGNDLRADVIFDRPIDSEKVDASDFSLGGIVADSATSSGNKVTLTFNSNSDSKKLDTNINKIKAKGITAELTIINDSNTKDVTGQSVTTNGTVVPYFYDAAPRTIVLRDNVNSPASNWTAVAGDTAEVTAVFDTPISSNSVKASDFSFSINGTTVDANNAEVINDANGNPTTVKFTFDTEDSAIFKSKIGSTLRILPKDNKDISTLKDGNGDYAYYEPSNDDVRGIKVDITGADVPAPAKVTLGSGSLGEAADKSITGLIDGTKYVVTDGTSYYGVLADGTLSEAKTDESDAKALAVALSGVTTITGLDNTKTYTVSLAD